MAYTSFTIYGYGAGYTRLSYHAKNTSSLHAAIDNAVQAGAKEITITVMTEKVLISPEIRAQKEAS